MRPHPRRASTDPSHPRAWATSDRSGFINNHDNLQWQYEYAGLQLINKRILVNPDEYDTPNRQLGTIVLPPDPTPIINARPEQYHIDEIPFSTRYTLDNNIRTVIWRGSEPPQRVITYQGIPAGRRT